MIRDFTNAFVIPTSKRAMLEASITDAYLAANPKLRQQILETHQLTDQLVETYQEVLGSEGSIRAKMLNTFIQEPWRYKRTFMINALMMSYRVFDESHQKYPRVLELVQKNDPEWLETVKANHAFKISRCKVPVYQI